MDEPVYGECLRPSCRHKRMRIVKPRQRFHPMCDPTPEEWWPLSERIAYLAQRTEHTT